MGQSYYFHIQLFKGSGALTVVHVKAVITVNLQTGLHKSADPAKIADRDSRIGRRFDYRIKIIFDIIVQHSADLRRLRQIGKRQLSASAVVKAGDRVVTGKYVGTEVKLDGQEYTILKQSDILAIVE